MEGIKTNRFVSNEKWVTPLPLKVNRRELDAAELAIVALIDYDDVQVSEVEECYSEYKITPAHNGGRVASYILEVALLHQNLPLVQYILNKQPHLVNGAGSHGVFIVFAAQISFLFFREFVSRGANIHLANEMGLTSLHVVVRQKNPDFDVLIYLFTNNAFIFHVSSADFHFCCNKVEVLWNRLFGPKENQPEKLVAL